MSNFYTFLQLYFLHFASYNLCMKSLYFNNTNKFRRKDTHNRNKSRKSSHYRVNNSESRQPRRGYREFCRRSEQKKGFVEEDHFALPMRNGSLKYL